jgi:hypothetical protein
VVDLLEVIDTLAVAWSAKLTWHGELLALGARCASAQKFQRQEQAFFFVPIEMCTFLGVFETIIR